MSMQEDFQRASKELRELAISTMHYNDAMILLSAIAEEMQQGKEPEYCYACAKERVIVSLEVYCHYSGLSIHDALRPLTDRTTGCKEHTTGWKE